MDVYSIVTEKIVNLLESGVVPWRRPWTSTGLPRNLVSKKPYRGVNFFLLSASKYVSPFWLTMRQANQLGGHVRKGEESTAVVFWKIEDAKRSTEDLDTERDWAEGASILTQILSRLEPRTMRVTANRARQAAEDRNVPARSDRSRGEDHCRNAEPARDSARGSKAFYSVASGSSDYAPRNLFESVRGILRNLAIMS